MTTDTAIGEVSARTQRFSRRSSRRFSWDVLRVVAISFVVIRHVTYIASYRPGIEPYPVAIAIPFGTAALLVLSGYFIGPTIRKSSSAGRWFRGRLARLLPAYLVTVLVIYLVSRTVVVRFNGASHQDGVIGLLFADPIVPADRGPDAVALWHVPDFNDLLLHVLLLHEFQTDFFHRLDGSFWTMPVQVAVFAGAALFWRSRLRHRLSAPTVLWGVTALSVVSQPLAALWRTLPTATGLYHAHLFAAGVAIYLWQRDRLPRKQLVLLLGSTVVLHALRTGTTLSVIAFTLTLVAMCAAARGRDWDEFPVLRTLRRPISWLAGISYGLYLVHQRLGEVLARALSEAGVSPWWLRLSIVVGAVVVAAWLLTVLVERPAQRVLTRRRRKTAADPAASTVVVGGGT